MISLLPRFSHSSVLLGGDFTLENGLKPSPEAPPVTGRIDDTGVSDILRSAVGYSVG